MELENELRESFARDSRQLVVVGEGATSAQRRARRRRHRHRSGVAVLAAAGVAGAAVVAIEARPSRKATVAVTPSTVPARDVKLSWQLADDAVGYDLGHVTDSDGVTYALSTAPGAHASAAPALYRSSDGTTWKQVGLGPDYVADFAARDGVLYSIGTSPGATADASRLRVSSSSDQGASWSATDVPIDFHPPASDVRLDVQRSAFVARGADATVVAASTSFMPDPSKLGKGPLSYSFGPNGIEILDLAKCKQLQSVMPEADAAGGPKCADPSIPKQTKPWSELGISDPAALQQSGLAISTDNRTWRQVTNPLTDGIAVQSVRATANGFILVGHAGFMRSDNAVEMFTSPDGEHWSPVAAPAGMSLSAASGDSVIARNFTQPAVVALSNDGGASWSTTELGSLGAGPVSAQTGYTAVDAGPLGFAVVYSQSGPNLPQKVTLFFSADGRKWTSTDLKAEGAPNAAAQAVRVGADHVEIVFLKKTGVGNDMKTVALLGTPEAP